MSDRSIARSEALFERAKRRIPGGVNSPARSFEGVGGTPLCIDEADGAWITDADGNAYVDYVGSWGPMLLGHAHPRVVEAVRSAAEGSTSFGAPCEAEVEIRWPDADLTTETFTLPAGHRFDIRQGGPPVAAD